MDDALRLAVLRAVGARGPQSGYARPEVEGYSRDQVDEAVNELRQGRYLEAAEIPQAFGDNPRHWEPSVLTAPSLPR